MSQLYLLPWGKIVYFQGFLSLEDDKEHLLNKPTLNKQLLYEMFSGKHIKTNWFMIKQIFLYLVECNVVRINVFTLELSRIQEFVLFQELFLRLNKKCKSNPE